MRFQSDSCFCWYDTERYHPNKNYSPKSINLNDYNSISVNLGKKNVRMNFKIATQLMESASDWNIHYLQPLKEPGLGIDYKSPFGLNLLHMAANLSRFDCMEELLDNNADVNIRRNFVLSLKPGENVLDLICQQKTQCPQHILDKIISRMKPDDIEQSLLMAIQFDNFYMVEFLSNVDLINNYNLYLRKSIKWNRTKLKFYFYHKCLFIDLNDLICMIENKDLQLLEYCPADVNFDQNLLKSTDLMIVAIKNSDLQIIKFLRDNGGALPINPNPNDFLGADLSVLEYLLESGLKIDLQNPNLLKTALYTDVSIEVLQYLIKLGASLSFELRNFSHLDEKKLTVLIENGYKFSNPNLLNELPDDVELISKILNHSNFNHHDVLSVILAKLIRIEDQLKLTDGEEKFD